MRLAFGSALVASLLISEALASAQAPAANTPTNTPAPPPAALGPEPTACNGKASSCKKPYNQVTYLTSNDAFAVGDTSVVRNVTQRLTMTAQLANGVRAFVLRFTRPSGSATGPPTLCLQLCDVMDAGDAATALRAVKTWIDGNTQEVVTFIVRNEGKFTPSEIAQPFKDAGLAGLAFNGKPSVADSWPTLADMIKTGKRVMVFATDIAAAADVPWIMPQTEYMWESPSQLTSVPATFACLKDRPTLSAIPVTQSLYMMNHFIFDPHGTIVGDQYVVGDAASAPQVNAATSIDGGVKECFVKWGLRPNFIVLNFVDQGEGQKAVSSMNDKKMGNTEVDGDAWQGTVDGAASIAHATIVNMILVAASIVSMML